MGKSDMLLFAFLAAVDVCILVYRHLDRRRLRRTNERMTRSLAAALRREEPVIVPAGEPREFALPRAS